MATKRKQLPLTVVDNQFERLRESVYALNPFEVNRVTGAEPLEFDVSRIHEAQFAKLTQMALRVREQGLGIGATLLGAPGIGKSHLLARLARWASEQTACYVYLHNIQAAPDDMGRYLMKCCVTQLAEDRLERLGQTPLFQIVQAAITQAAKVESITTLNGQNRKEVFTRLANRLGGDVEILNVIFTFFESVLRASKAEDAERRAHFNKKAALAVRWLKGDWIDVADLTHLNILHGDTQGCIRLADDRVLAVILVIARLARESNRPFILCLDQVDTMRRDRMRALFIELHHLLDGQSSSGQREVSNLLVVVSGVEEDMRALYSDQAFPEASAARLNFTEPISLHAITESEVRDLLRARLHKFADHYPYPSPIKAFFQNDELFPLGEKWFKNSFPDRRTPPRVAISRARQRWNVIQDRLRNEEIELWLKSWCDEENKPQPNPILPEQRGKLVDEKVRLKLIEAVNARRLQSGALPADAGNLLNLTSMLLQQCVNQNCGYTIDRVERSDVNGKINLVVLEQDGKLLRNHAQFVVTSSKTSAAARLRNLLESNDANPVDYRLLITDHDRMPLQLGAAGQQYLDELKKLGKSRFMNVPLTFEQYAQLDAMSTVMNSAQAGDLEIETSPGQFDRVQRDEVVGSLHRLNAYRDHVLLRHFLTEPAEPDGNGGHLEVMPTNELREFIIHKLSLEMGANLSQLVQSFCATRSCRLKSDICFAWAKEIVLTMNDERAISAKPWNDDFYLTSL